MKGQEHRASVSPDASVYEARRWRYEQLGRAAVASLGKNRISALYVPDRQEALRRIMAMIPEGATVSRGDSVTVLQIGILDELRRRNCNQIVDPFPERKNGDDPDIAHFSIEERYEVMRRALLADVFLTGTNAITLDGKLVNIDAYGNRVAAMIFGPHKVIVTAGANKIVANVDDAIKRIKQISAPQVAKRHDLYHWTRKLREVREEQRPPCEITGICTDCKSPVKLCHYTTIIEGESQYYKEPRLSVVIIGEELGQ